MWGSAGRAAVRPQLVQPCAAHGRAAPTCAPACQPSWPPAAWLHALQVHPRTSLPSSSAARPRPRPSRRSSRRLLDDNRELYVPELQEVVRPHPHFMLFATQNPPGIYAGRKTLSRQARERFWGAAGCRLAAPASCLRVPSFRRPACLDPVPACRPCSPARSCAIAPSYAAKLVAVQRELQRRRSASNVFAGRHGFITPRDLFRCVGGAAGGEGVGAAALVQGGVLDAFMQAQP